MRSAEEMTDEQIEALVAKTAEATAERVIKQTLLSFGIDASDPLEMQADMRHLRNWRESVNAVKRQGMMTSVIVVISGVLGLIWMAINNPPPGP
jgi:hypothetical protein